MRRDKFCILQFHYLGLFSPQALLSFTELGSQKTKFLEFFKQFLPHISLFPFSEVFVCLAWWWVGVCFCFCFLRLFFIEGQRNRGQSLVKSWFPGLIFLSPLSNYLHLFVLFSFLDDFPQPFSHNSFSWNFNLCYHVFNLREFSCKCSLFSEYSFLIASWSCFMYIISTIISEFIIYGFLKFWKPVSSELLSPFVLPSVRGVQYLRFVFQSINLNSWLVAPLTQMELLTMAPQEHELVASFSWADHIPTFPPPTWQQRKGSVSRRNMWASIFHV